MGLTDSRGLPKRRCPPRGRSGSDGGGNGRGGMQWTCLRQPCGGLPRLVEARPLSVGVGTDGGPAAPERGFWHRQGRGALGQLNPAPAREGPGRRCGCRRRPTGTETRSCARGPGPAGLRETTVEMTPAPAREGRGERRGLDGCRRDPPPLRARAGADCVVGFRPSGDPAPAREGRVHTARVASDLPRPRPCARGPGGGGAEGLAGRTPPLRARVGLCVGV